MEQLQLINQVIQLLRSVDGYCIRISKLLLQQESTHAGACFTTRQFPGEKNLPELGLFVYTEEEDGLKHNNFI